MEHKQNPESLCLSEADDLSTLLAFTPVALRRRYDGWTPEQQRLYVAALAECGRAGEAAARVGMTEQSAARLRRRPGAEAFARACEAAYRIGARRRRALAASRARQCPAGSSGSHDFPPQGSFTIWSL